MTDPSADTEPITWLDKPIVDDRPEELVHGLRKGGESWCGGHHVRASLKPETVTCPDCLVAMGTAPNPLAVDQ